MAKIKKVKIENKNLLENALENGCNLFVGAGFSLSAKDKNGRNLPTGVGLRDELKLKFGYKQEFNLEQIALMLENTRKNEFLSYLEERFDVAEFDEKYYALNLINIKSIFTTNIDTLVYKVFEANNKKYINDLSVNGPVVSDKLSVDFLALHGNILNKERPLIFNSMSLASAFSDSPNIWKHLISAIDKYPTIFCGYSMSDSGVLQALGSSQNDHLVNKEKWILLRSEDIDFAEYYRSLGFNIIEGDTIAFLDFLSSKSKEDKKDNKSDFSDIRQMFYSNVVPDQIQGLRARPISDFFMGNPPIWSDIFGKQISTTSHFVKIKDKIFSNKNIIVLGTPASGKTTLLMQLAAFVEHKGITVMFNDIESLKADVLVKNLNGRPAIVFIDNFSDSIEAFNTLASCNNIKLIGFERGHNFGIVSHLIEENRFDFVNVTKLSDRDIQSVYNSLPASLRGETLKKEGDVNYADDSLFEFVNRNVKTPLIKDRFREVLEQLETSNPILAEFLVLCCYVHYARTPLSFDMVMSYFDNSGMNYRELLDLRKELGDLIKDYTGELILDDEQDYYYPRSVYLAEAVISQTKSYLLKKVISNVIDNIPTFKICSYKNFRRKAFDRNIVGQAFTNWIEGKEFYEKAFKLDYRNPYVLQQGALYLSQKKRYMDAFHWIDRAINMTDNKIFSIRNSHAIILFEANINSGDMSDGVRSELDKSMNILEKCYKDDKRKTFHALRYGNQAIQYHERYSDKDAYDYLEKALRWLREEYKLHRWNIDVERMISRLENQRRIASLY